MERVAEIGVMVYYHDRESGNVPALITNIHREQVALVVFDALKTGGRHVRPEVGVSYGEQIGDWSWPPEPVQLFDAMIQSATDRARLRREETTDT